MNFALSSLSHSGGTQAASSAASSASSTSISSDPKHRKLADAAQQFEGMLMQELLKPMREHSFGSGDSDGSSSDDPDSSGFADTLSSFGSESLATAISRSGGLGISRLVIQQVEKQHPTRPNPSVTRS